jgi:hypothetical protein
LHRLFKGGFNFHQDVFVDLVSLDVQ